MKSDYYRIVIFLIRNDAYRWLYQLQYVDEISAKKYSKKHTVIDKQCAFLCYLLSDTVTSDEN